MRCSIAIYLLLLVSCCTGNDTNVRLKELLKNISRDSYFLAVNLEANGKDDVYIIENRDCFLFFNKKMKFNEDEYQKFIYSKISDNKSIFGEIDSLQEYGFRKVESTKNSLGTPTQIIEKHFNRFRQFLTIAPSVYSNTQTLIISQLFHQGIYCRINDETGLLMINVNELPPDLLKYFSYN
jgi:hypothetical protein